MIRYTLKSFWAHKRRLVSTFVAIVLGVGFVAGAMVLGNTLSRAYDDIFAAATRGTDAFVRSASSVGSDFGEQRARIDIGLVDQVDQIDGVEAAAPVIGTLVQLIGPDGEPVRDTGFGPPTTGERWGEVDELNPWEVVVVTRRSSRTMSSSTGSAPNGATSGSATRSRSSPPPVPCG